MSEQKPNHIDEYVDGLITRRDIPKELAAKFRKQPTKNAAKRMVKQWLEEQRTKL